MTDDLQTIVQRMVDAGESEENIASVIQAYKPADTPEQPGMLQRGLSAVGGFVKNHPTEIGAIAGGLAAVPLTGGASLIPALAAAGLGGAGGAGLGMIAGAAAGSPNIPSTPGGVVGRMASEGVSQAAGEVVGQGASKALSKGAERLYQAVLKPTLAARTENPNLVATGLKYALPISKGGAEKAEGLVGASKAAADKLVSDAAALPGAAMVDPRQVVTGIVPAVSHARNLQVPRPVLQGIGEHARDFLHANPSPMPLTRAQQMVRTEDQFLNDAYRAAVDRGDVIKSGSIAAEKGINDEMRGTLRKLVPGLREQNGVTRSIEGARQAIERRSGQLGNNSVVGMQHLINAGIGATAGSVEGARGGPAAGATGGMGTFLALEALTHPASASRLAIMASHTPTGAITGAAKTTLSPLLEELLKRLPGQAVPDQQ